MREKTSLTHRHVENEIEHVLLHRLPIDFVCNAFDDADDEIRKLIVRLDV
jgi:hypothetical protein